MTRGTEREAMLAGIAVIDLSTTVAGAVAARLLAEAGADVVKVESPEGDPLRERAPVGFATWNRSKRGVVLDLVEPEQRAGLDALLARADVLVHDRPPSEAGALGLDETTLAERFPGLLVAGVTAFPDWHDRRDDPAEEILVQAVSGVMDEQQGNRQGPIYTRMPYATWCAALLLTGGVMARLVQRARTGMVGNVRTSLLQGALVPTSLYWQRSDRLPDELEETHTLPKVWPGASLSLFECGDGEWIQLAGSLGGWIESPPVLELLALRDEVDLSEAGVTPENRPRWQEVFRFQDSATWLARFAESDVPCMLVRDLGDCFADEQARLNGYVVEVEDPVVGSCTQAAAPFTTDPPCAVRKPAPRAGGESRVGAVLKSFGRATRGDVRRAGTTDAPLDGLTVLDFGTMVAAPFASQCFADLGARVVKVERLGGERGRTLTQFGGSNRGKESLAVDLKRPETGEPLRRLLSSADVVVHNIRAGAAARLGLDADGLRSVNERVVLTHVSANGALGPMAPYPGYDPTAQAMTGWERANVGHGQEPMWMRNSVLDVASGLAAFVGGLLGRYHREVTGTPGHCGTSLLGVGITIASETALDESGTPMPVSQIDPGQTGTSPWHRIYRAVDGWFAVAARTPAQRAAVLGVAGTAEEDRLEASFETRSRDDLVSELGGSGVPVAAVAEAAMDAFFDDSRHRVHGVSRRLHADGYGALDVVGGFWTLAAPGESAADVKETVPASGADSVAVLAALGYDADRIAGLLADDVVETT